MKKAIWTTGLMVLVSVSAAPAAFAASSTGASGQVTGAVPTVSTAKVQSDLKAAVAWMNKNGASSLPFWVDVADFAATGSFTKETWTKASFAKLSASTDYAKAILGVLASGQDPHDVAGINLVAKLAASQLTSGDNTGKFADNIDGTGTDLINNQAWAIIALEDAGGAHYNRAAAAMWLLSKQNQDGGFGYSTQYSTSDPDDTAAALVALRLLGFGQGDPAVAKALAYLKTQQAKDGGFENGATTSNSDSTGVTIDALTAYGIPASSWTVASGTPVTALLADFNAASGGFNYDNTGGEYSGVSAMSTRDAIFGLAAFATSQSVYQRLQAKPLTYLNPYWTKIYEAGGGWANHHWETWAELRPMAIAGSYLSDLTPAWQKVVKDRGMYVEQGGKRVFEAWDAKLATEALTASFGLDTAHLNQI
ncbi:MAG: hypothetical protein K6T78_00530 [Alicyclobacillus sp.]|nr:hypothetical protein [Alicyclobacillus sp.]